MKKPNAETVEFINDKVQEIKNQIDDINSRVRLSNDDLYDITGHFENMNKILRKYWSNDLLKGKFTNETYSNL
jgi:Txe/YoeB family toxin of Txe-Axe toxin-antitoxin module